MRATPRSASSRTPRPRSSGSHPSSAPSVGATHPGTEISAPPGVPLRIGHLTGNCEIAGVSVGVSTPSPGVINGYGWVNLGDSASALFQPRQGPAVASPLAVGAVARDPGAAAGARDGAAAREEVTRYGER